MILYVVTYEDRVTDETIVLGVFDTKGVAITVQKIAETKNQNAFIHECMLNTHNPYEFQP